MKISEKTYDFMFKEPIRKVGHGVTAAVKEFCKNDDVVYQLTGLDNNFLNSKAGSVDDWDSDEFSWVIKKSNVKEVHK